MGRFSNFLKQRNPRTGRVIRESGDFFNIADSDRLREQADVDRASRLGNLYRGFWQANVPPLTTHDIILDVPVGIDLFGFTRITVANGVSLHAQFMTCTSFVSAEGPFIGKSLDRRAGKKANSLASIHRASSVTGAVVQDPVTELFVATSGPVRAPSGQTETGAQPAFDSSELPLFRHENKDDTITALLTLYLFWQELPTET